MSYVQDAGCDVAVIGLGFVGLPAALLLAHGSAETIGVDIDERIVTSLESGVCPLKEEGIDAIFNAATTKANFTVRRKPPVADAYMIAVPTPLDERRKIADLAALKSATKSIVPTLRRGALVIVESTVPPLTCQEVIRPILEQTGLTVGKDIFLSHCPERLFPGNVVHEIVTNARIIGGCCQTATERSAELYRRFCKGELMLTDDVTAEFCKITENAYRDVNIALANELANVADRLGVSIQTVIELANRHPRVNILKPGIGVGGHCIPIDPWFIAEAAPEETVIIPTARRINDARPGQIAAKVRRAVAHLPEPRLAVYGVTYKPDVNDQRESPAWVIVRLLRDDGYDVAVLDPVAGQGEARDVFEFAKGRDALIVLVEHREILEHLHSDYDRLAKSLNHPIVLRF